MKEPRPSHDPNPGPARPTPPEAELAAVFESLWKQKFTGKIVLHFRSGFPSVVDQKGPQNKRWLIRGTPTP